MIKIIFIIVLLVLILILSSHYKEQYKNDIEFLGINSVCKILKKIWFNYNTLDIKLRDIPNYYKNNIYKFYCDHLLTFNNLDTKLIHWVIDGMKKRIPKHLLFIFKDIKFAKFKNNIENGYPHTRSDIIFVTENFITNILEYYNNNDIVGAIRDIGSVIIHECIHVWQRKEPKNFVDLYTNYWNFIKVNHIHNSKYLESIKRYNPDGVDTNWLFNINGKYIYILSIYTDEARNIGNVVFIGIYLEKSGKNYIIPANAKRHDLQSIKEYTSFFKHLYGNHYHPNEISAELMSIYYLKIMKISHKNYTNIGYKNMLVWLNKYLKKYN